MEVARDLLNVIHYLCGIYVGAACLFAAGRMVNRAIRESS